MYNEDENKTNNYQTPPSDMLSLTGNNTKSEVDSNLNQSVEVKNNNTVITENNLSDAVIGLEPVEKQEDYQKKDMDSLLKETYSPKVEKEFKTRKENKLFLIVSILSGSILLIVLVFAIFSKTNTFKFNAGAAYYQNKIIENVGEHQTKVVTDNVYKGVKINNVKDATNLIVKDSNNQKAKCEDTRVKEVESDIEEKYDIVAVNLCELDYEFAKELENVISTIYSEFPNIKGYLTNLTLINTPEYTNYIASFVSATLFAKSNTINTYPNVYKMSIFLNANYFLNLKYFDASIEDSLAYGYFPPNATKNSIVAHEFGHYLSFLAQYKNTSKLSELVLLEKKNYSSYSKLITDSNNGTFSKRIINEAFENYKKTDNVQYGSVDKFKSTISEYAIVRDGNGKYIYDETIAEAFHDYYVNRTNAKPASIEIVKVLKKYLNK